MTRQRIVPIAVALALTVAAGLSITQERMRWQVAATLAPATTHPASDTAIRNYAVPYRGDNAAVQRASDTILARPTPGVGSRALVGD